MTSNPVQSLADARGRQAEAQGQLAGPLSDRARRLWSTILLDTQVEIENAEQEIARMRPTVLASYTEQELREDAASAHVYTPQGR
jgi:hypothetical protein